MTLATERPHRRETARRRAERVWVRRRAEAEAARAAHVARPRLRLLVLGAAALVIAALLAHTRPFLLHVVRLSGLQQASAAEVQADLDVPPGAYTWQLRPWTLTRRLRRDPLIAAARVRYLGLNGIAIQIRERVPAVGVLQGRTLWEVDAGGRVLRGLPEALGRGPVVVPGLGIPIAVVTGAHLAALAAGQRVTAPPVLAAMRVAESLGGAVATAAGTVVISGDQVGVMTLGGIPVNYGNGSDARRKTQILLGVLQATGAQRAEVTAIDLASVTTPSLTLRPGSPPLTLNGVATSG